MVQREFRCEAKRIFELISGVMEQSYAVENIRVYESFLWYVESSQAVLLVIIKCVVKNLKVLQ